jgi:hypothetical protein
LLTAGRDLPTGNTSTVILRGATLRRVIALVPGSRSQFIARQPNLGPCLVVRSRQVPVAGIARTDRVRHAPDIARCPSGQASLGSDHRGNPPRPAIASQLSAPTRSPIVVCPRHRLHAFPPLCEIARKEEGENPGAFNQIGTRPPGRWGNARRANTPAPQSKPVAHASRLVAQTRRRRHSSLG